MIKYEDIKIGRRVVWRSEEPTRRDVFGTIQAITASGRIMIVFDNTNGTTLVYDAEFLELAKQGE